MARKALLVTDSKIWTAETEYAMAVARAESALGWEVTLAAPEGSAALEAAGPELLGVPLPGPDPSRSPSDFIADARFLAGLAARSGPAFVHSSRSAAHACCAAAVGRRIPLLHLRGGARKPRVGAVNRFLYHGLTKAVIVSSRRIESWMTEGLLLPPTRVHRLLAPVDVRRFADASRDPTVRPSLGVARDAPLIVNVARLSPIKGQHVLVRAMAGVIRARPEAVLVLVGEAWSGEPAGVRRLAEELGIGESLVVTGRRDDVPSLLCEAAVCVCSSVGSEENSRAVSEYMAAGRPVVAASVGVIPELVEHGATGLLATPGDVDALASGILEMLDSPEEAGRMASAAGEFARARLSRESFAKAVSGILEGAGISV